MSQIQLSETLPPTAGVLLICLTERESSVFFPTALCLIQILLALLGTVFVTIEDNVADLLGDTI